VVNLLGPSEVSQYEQPLPATMAASFDFVNVDVENEGRPTASGSSMSGSGSVPAVKCACHVSAPLISDHHPVIVNGRQQLQYCHWPCKRCFTMLMVSWRWLACHACGQCVLNLPAVPLAISAGFGGAVSAIAEGVAQGKKVGGGSSSGGSSSGSSSSRSWPLCHSCESAMIVNAAQADTV
jgi:hypothetical protein